MTTRHHRRECKRDRPNERGFVTVEFVAGVALLLLPTALLVMILPTFAERVSMARVASREAARVFVLTKDPAQAEAAVQTVSDNYNLPDDAMTVSFTGNPNVRGGRVTANVSTVIPITQIPIFDITVGEINVNESHTEVVDLYRSKG